MKKLFILVVILTTVFLCPFLSNAQEKIEPLCGASASFSKTTLTEEGVDLSNISLTNAHSTKVGNIPINFTILRKSDCPDGDRYNLTVGILQNAVASINQYFPFGADFKVAKVKYVIDDAMAELPDATLSAAFTKDKPLYDKYAFKNGAIEVFIVTTPFSYAWCPEGIKWYPAQLVVKDWVDKYNFIALSEAKILGNNSVEMELAHELGHYFGLIHTHENTQTYTYDPVAPYATHSSKFHELKDGSNITQAGDASVYLLHSRVKDTPADPNAKRCLPSGGCPATMECEIKDANSQFYKPDMFNIMGYYYSKDKCHGKGKFHFSPEQEKYMLFMYQYNASRNNIKNADADFIVSDFHAGEIRRECSNSGTFGEEYSNVIVNILYPNQSVPNPSVTNSCARYYGANNTYTPNQGIVKIQPISDNSNYLFRVNMVDVATIARHLLKIAPFTTSYQKIAADINRSGHISVNDVMLLYNLVTQKTTSLAPTPSWQFLPKYYENDMSNFNIANPFPAVLKGKPYPSYLNEVILDHSQIVNFDLYEPDSWSFKAIKMGDVICNGSKIITEAEYAYITSALSGSPIIQAGTSYTAQVNVGNTADILAYQFALKANPNVVIEGIELGDSQDNNLEDFFNVDNHNNTIYHIWHSQTWEAVTKAANHTLYKIKFKALQNITDLKNIFTVESNKIEPLFFDVNKNIVKMPLKINITERPSARPAVTNNALAISTYPNPASDELYLRFTLKEAGNVILTLTDMFGRILKTLTSEGIAGKNDILVEDIQQFNAGMIQYQIQTNEGSFQGKVLLRK